MGRTHRETYALNREYGNMVGLKGEYCERVIPVDTAQALWLDDAHGVAGLNPSSLVNSGLKLALFRRMAASYGLQTVIRDGIPAGGVAELPPIMPPPVSYRMFRLQLVAYVPEMEFWLQANTGESLAAAAADGVTILEACSRHVAPVVLEAARRSEALGGNLSVVSRAGTDVPFAGRLQDLPPILG